MLAWTLAAALAASPNAEPSVPLAADAVRAVSEVHLQPAWPYTWTANPRELGAAVVLVVRVDPDRARPRQVARPMLYVDAELLEVVAHSEDWSCVVGILPRPALDRAAVYWGPDTLPEEVDAASGARALAAAQRAGITPIDLRAAHVQRSTADLTDLLGWRAYAERQLDRCR